MRSIGIRVLIFALLAFIAPNYLTIEAQVVRPYRVNDRTVQLLLNRIESRTDTYRRAMNSALDQSRLNGTREEDQVIQFITEFENATDRLKQNFDARQSVSGDVETVLGYANYIQDFMRRNRLTTTAQSQWRSISADLNTLAGYYNVRWNRTLGYYVTTGNPNTTGNMGTPYRVTDREVQSVITRLELRSDDFRRILNNALDRSNLNGTSAEDSINGYVTEFENATDSLKRKFDSRSSVGTDVQEVLTRASAIDAFLKQNRLPNNVNNQWNLVTRELNTLSNYYNVSWNWNNYPTFPGAGNNNNNTGFGMLTGTYRLNSVASDNVVNVIDRAISNNSYDMNRRERVRRNLERRLSSPEMIAIDYVNRQFTIASSNSPQATIMVDGTSRSETNPNGRTINTKAESMGNGVNISYEGDRANDFYLTFTPINNNQIRVTRRLYLENQNELITVNSIYDKVSNTPQWSTVTRTTGSPVYGNNNQTAYTDFVVPNGTRMTASLNTPISTKNATNGQRFTMDVTAPGEFQGAIIEGTIAQSERSGRVTGRSEILLNFETIRLRDGRTYRYSALIDSIRNAKGDVVNINNEGVIRDNNQTTKTVTRAGIGAALGAIIGAIAGGGQGAAIGAAIGAGAGAGSVVLQGRDDLELETGTQFELTSSAPASMRSNN